tara:strand:- start:971 stop:3403 length:2433 start_codon:yes stop_codon:yes gene_type:complete
MPINERNNSSSRGATPLADETINNTTSVVDVRSATNSSIINRAGVVNNSTSKLLGAKKGDSIFNDESGKIETWNGSSWNVSAGELNVSTSLASNRDSSIYADGKAGKLDSSGLSGWNFKNDYNGEKINWYYVYNENGSNEMTLTTLTSMYAVVKIYNEREFHFSVYTKRENDGNDYSWYRSRVNYELTTAFDGLSGETVLVYWGEEPKSFSSLKRIEMPNDPTFSFGPQGSSEDILFAGLATDSSAQAGEYDFTVKNLGYINDKRETNTVTKIGADFDLINTEITNLKSFKEAVELGRFFRGYVADEDGMNALTGAARFEYVIRMDTSTIWEHNGTDWYDTLIVGSLEGIAQEEELVLNYSDTKYFDLDGLNDYVDLTGVPAEVMDFTESWSLGIELAGSVDTVNDSTYITLFKRGNNEITLRKGGSNWGFYVYSNGYSVAQANTWYAPSAGSRILVVSNGTQISYYLDGTLRSRTSYNASTQYQDNSGNLEIGKGGITGSNWTGGVNNLMIMNGGSSDLGKDQLAEFNAQGNVSNMSFYPSVTDFVTLGERPFPSVLGLKQVVSGEIKDSTESVVIVKNPAGPIGTPFVNSPGMYVKLDGTNNYIEFDNADADVLDFSVGKTWAVATKFNSVSGVTDYVKTTLWSRGTNEITLVRGGTNWGLYVYCNGASIGQANTWYAPNDDSTIVFTFDGTKLRYYIDGALRSTLSVNSSISQNNPSGNLYFGKSGAIGVNWYGGVEEAFIIEGSNSVLTSSQINEFGTVAGASLSYYNILEDYFKVGIDAFPSINGEKTVITGNLINGTEEDFINI